MALLHRSSAPCVGDPIARGCCRGSDLRSARSLGLVALIKGRRETPIRQRVQSRFQGVGPCCPYQSITVVCGVGTPSVLEKK
jgi:hypothetical protein